MTEEAGVSIILIAIYKFAGFINQPGIKEAVKNGVGVISFLGAITEVYALCGRGTAFSFDDTSACQRWQLVSSRGAQYCASLSILLSAAVSRPGCLAIGYLLSSLPVLRSVDKIFGPNVNFAVNPWHPRHVASFAALILALPALFETLRAVAAPCSDRKIEFTNWCLLSRKRFFTLFNTCTSRPALHVINQLFRSIL